MAIEHHQPAAPAPAQGNQRPIRLLEEAKQVEHPAPEASEAPAALPPADPGGARKLDRGGAHVRTHVDHAGPELGIRRQGPRQGRLARAVGPQERHRVPPERERPADPPRQAEERFLEPATGTPRRVPPAHHPRDPPPLPEQALPVPGADHLARGLPGEGAPERLPESRRGARGQVRVLLDQPPQLLDLGATRAGEGSLVQDAVQQQAEDGVRRVELPRPTHPGAPGQCAAQGARGQRPALAAVAKGGDRVQLQPLARGSIEGDEHEAAAAAPGHAPDETTVGDDPGEAPGMAGIHEQVELPLARAIHARPPQPAVGEAGRVQGFEHGRERVLHRAPARIRQRVVLACPIPRLTRRGRSNHCSSHRIGSRDGSWSPRPPRRSPRRAPAGGGSP